MTYENLITAVEVSAQERMEEIHNRARRVVEEITREAQEKVDPTKKRHLDEAVRQVEIEKTKLLSEVREKSRIEVIRTKNDIFEKVFEEAARRLGSIRGQPLYKKTFQALLVETLKEMGEGDVVIHIDPRDDALCREGLTELKKNCTIVADLASAGGLNAHTRDERFIVFNTLESRLQRAKEFYRPEVFSLLYG